MMKLLLGGSPSWKPIKGYEEIYEVSSAGQVRNVVTGRTIKPKIEKNGYVRVHLSKNGTAKSVLLHRVVATAFLGNPNRFLTVNHKDENKQNNSAHNLEWCDMSYQNRYGNGAIARNKAKERPVIQMDMSGRYIQTWGSIKEAAEALGLNSSTIVCVCKGKRRYKSTGGYKFRYAEGVIQHG